LGTVLLIAAVAVTVGLTAPAASAQDMPTVMLSMNSQYGMVLTDSGGWSLYTWDGDQVGMSNCYDPCTEAWMPFSTDGDLVQPGNLPGTLDWVDRGDGSWQIGLDGWPLYYFAGDANPGDVTGNGSMGFGAQWFIAAFAMPDMNTAPAAQVPAPVPPAAQLPQPAAELPMPAPPAASNPPIPAQTGPLGEPFPPQIPPGFGGPGLPPNFIPEGYGQTLTIVAPPNGTINLNWIANPAAQSYRIYTTPSSQPMNFGVQQTIPQGIGQMVSNALVTGLTPGQTYLLQVRSVDPTGLELAAPTAAVMGTPPVGGLPPGLGLSTNLNIVSSSGTTVTLAWTPIAGARAYQILQSITPQGPFVPANMSQGNGAGTTIVGLQPNTTYFFQLSAIDGLGNQTPMSNIVSISTTAAASIASTSISIGAMTATTATLSWAPVPGAASYQVGQALNPNGPFASAILTNPNSTNVTVNGLTPGVTYYFQVTALDLSGNQIISSPAAAAVTASAGMPLTGTMVSPPSSLVVTTTTGSTANLTWAASQGATSYAILQSTSASGPFSPASTASMSGTTATVGGLAPATAYYFQVVAMDPAGHQSMASNAAPGMTTSALATPR